MFFNCLWNILNIAFPDRASIFSLFTVYTLPNVYGGETAVFIYMYSV